MIIKTFIHQKTRGGLILPIGFIFNLFTQVGNSHEMTTFGYCSCKPVRLKPSGKFRVSYLHCAHQEPRRGNLHIAISTVK